MTKLEQYPRNFALSSFHVRDTRSIPRFGSTVSPCHPGQPVRATARFTALRRRASIGVAFLLTLSSASAQGSAPYPSVLSYRTVKVADGVYAFITPEERTGFQSGNSVAIIGDDGVLVFDSGNIPGSTRRQIAEIRKLTDKPVRYVVNSHWHPDHNLGNSIYRAEFPGVRIIGTSATRAGILERVPTYFGQMKGFAEKDSLMKLRLSTGRMRDGSAMPDNVRQVWTLVVGITPTSCPRSCRPSPRRPISSPTTA